MPYIPRNDRGLIDVGVEKVVKAITKTNVVPILVLEYFYTTMRQVCSVIRACEECYGIGVQLPDQKLGRAIYDTARKYGYKGAWLGGLNYATTRLIQEIPKELVKKGFMKSELRYWYHAEVVGYLGALVHHFQSIANTNWIDQGFAGVFEDVKDEYKWRVNRSYEAEQIVKSGDCYDAPFYTKLVQVVDSKGFHRGYLDIYVKRSDEPSGRDIIGRIVIDD